MKNMKSWMLAAILLCGTACVTGNTNADKEAKGTTAVAEPAKGVDVIMDAINQYLVDSIGSQYTAGDMCIPVIMMTCSDGMKGDSVFMWGDYWVFNYKVAGDTLKCVSGGDHPGKMLLKKNENGKFQVLSFEQVEDGHGNVESAKRIFGDYYDALHAVNSDEKYREKTRASAIADYVKANKLPVKYYQDYGWPAKVIPAK